MKKRLFQLLDVVSFRLGNYALEQIAADLRPDLFRLRMEALSFFKERERLDQLTFESERIADGLSEKLPEALRKKFAEVVSAYQAFLQSQSLHSTEVEKSIQFEHITWESIQSLRTLPQRNFHQLPDWLNYSLDFELGLLLLLSPHMNLATEKLEKDAFPFFEQSAKNFFAMASLLGLWSPAVSSEGFIGQIRITRSLLELEFNPREVMDQQQLESLLN